MTLAETIKATMTDLQGDDDVHQCENCGEDVALAFALAHDGYCPACHHESQCDAAEDAVIEAREDLAGLLEELADVRARIAEKKAELAEARKALAALKAVK